MTEADVSNSDVEIGIGKKLKLLVDIDVSGSSTYASGAKNYEPKLYVAMDSSLKYADFQSNGNYYEVKTGVYPSGDPSALSAVVSTDATDVDLSPTDPDRLVLIGPDAGMYCDKASSSISLYVVINNIKAGITDPDTSNNVAIYAINLNCRGGEQINQLRVMHAKYC